MDQTLHPIRLQIAATHRRRIGGNKSKRADWNREAGHAVRRAGASKGRKSWVLAASDNANPRTLQSQLLLWCGSSMQCRLDAVPIGLSDLDYLHSTCTPGGMQIWHVQRTLSRLTLIGPPGSRLTLICPPGSRLTLTGPPGSRLPGI